ncbi:sulfite exporter TauE/SafE family protein [Amnibacterium endophyticum]|uniref:Probable membrane transporter protein n=1 Tax=Amnibacterium endophyticum TaxID=2109337 RepID=A0ABW4LJR0_9MICO
MEWSLSVVGVAIGVLVGLTGMGGGALMTPILVFFFGVDALTAISSDLVISLFMKPFGSIVHLVRRTVDLRLVGLLCAGSVPAAFVGALITTWLPDDSVQSVLLVLLGCALLLAAAGLIARSWMQMTRARPLGEGPARMARPATRARPLPTVLLGAAAGLIVGLTSVGAGSIVIVTLLLLYPALKASQLVGTDLVQAVPLVGSAALGHALFGSVNLGVAGSVLIGAIPGVLLGAWLSSRAPGGIIRRALAILLMASGLKLLGLPTPVVIGAGVAALVLGNVLWIALRSRFSASLRAERDAAGRSEAEGSTTGG